MFPGEASAEVEVKRIFGQDRIETVVEISGDGWDSSDTVVLARQDDFPDALAGSPLAYHKDAPILLTSTDSLSPATREEIQRLNAQKAVILGGEAAVSAQVEKELGELNLDIKRVGGKNRYETAKKIAEKLPSYDRAVIAYGNNFPDALAVAPYASREGMPIFLTDTDTLPDVTQKALEEVQNTLVVGGEAVINNRVAQKTPSPNRVAGKDRYETAVKIINEFNLQSPKAYVATGENFADALTGSVLAGRNTAPVYLVRQNRVPGLVMDNIEVGNKEKLVILGGENAVSPVVKSMLEIGLDPSSPEDNEDLMFNDYGTMEPEYSRYYIEKALDTVEFTDDGVEGYVPKLPQGPEGQNWDIRFTVHDHDGTRINLTYGVDFDFGQGDKHFNKSVNWSDIKRGTFSFGVTPDTTAVDRINIYWPSMEREEMFLNRW